MAPMTKKSLYVIISICCYGLFFPQAPVHGRQNDFSLLNSFLGDSPQALGTGSFDNSTPVAGDPYHPTAFIGLPQRLSFHYRDENVINKINGDWENTKVGALTRETRGMFSSTLPFLKESAFAFSYKDFAFHADVDTDSRNTMVSAAQVYNSRVISVGSHPFAFLKAGIGLERQAGQDELFYDLALTPGPGLTVGYRRFRRTLVLDNGLFKDGYLAVYRHEAQEDVKELSLNMAAKDLLEINTVIESTGKHNNLDLELATFWGEHLIARYKRFNRQTDFFNPIFINNDSGGHLQGRYTYSGQALTCEIPSGPTTYFLGLKESLFKITGAGKVSGAYILDFWQNLLAGDRYFNYALDTRTTQYHFGLENQTTAKLTTRMGLQYLVVKPEGNLDNWTPIPFINVGRLDEDHLGLGYSKFTLGLISFGFSYRLAGLELTYGFGQFIPLQTVKRREPASPAAAEDSGGDSTSLGGTGTLADYIRHIPGGNLQSLTVTWYF